MSAEKGKAITARQLIADKGFMTLYQGALATTMRQGSSVAVRFFCFDKIKAGMSTSLGHKDINDAPGWVSFLAGGTGGAISVCLNNPIDLAKSKIQAGLYTRYGIPALCTVLGLQSVNARSPNCTRSPNTHLRLQHGASVEGYDTRQGGRRSGSRAVRQGTSIVLVASYSILAC